MKRYWPALLVFAVILVHGSLFGLTDDEAYYWVLAQKPALGYAFHPPMVAWSIAASQKLLGWLLGSHSVAMVRFPAALSAGLLVAMGMHWMKQAGAEEARVTRRGAWVLVSLVGLFSLSWMMVPDLPLFVGWTLAFLAAWEICFAAVLAPAWYSALGFGVTLAILSKYSGVLGAVSAFCAVALWAPRDRRFKGWAAVLLGGLVAALPILWWNAQHEWASILYQVRERHGEAQVSWLRYARFWAIELVLAGPGVFALFWLLPKKVLRREASRPEAYALVWALPGAFVFFLQPLVADFKPHWALIVWWPVALTLGWAWSRAEAGRLARVQAVYGLGLGALVLLSCHLPVGGWVMSYVRQGTLDPRLDVTNDLYGWSDLREFVATQGGQEALLLPMIGSRYQTASQAAFAMGEGARVTMLPRDVKAMDEWPNLAVSDGQGPAWPELTTTVLYVGDNRYDGGPEFAGAKCEPLRSFEKKRAGLAAKTILLWKCVPSSLGL